LGCDEPPASEDALTAGELPPFPSNGLARQLLSLPEKLQRNEAYLAEAEKLTHTGTWAWDPRTQKVLYCSEEMGDFFVSRRQDRETVVTIGIAEIRDASQGSGWSAPGFNPSRPDSPRE
jgi:hypothetical protein